jgi:protein O-mannosyl-transferase
MAQKGKVSNKAASQKTQHDFRFLYPIIIILTVFLMYGRTLKYQYVKMDDTDLIVDNESFIKHSNNIPQAFKQSCFKIPGHLTESKSYYRPMLIVSFIIDAQLHGARSSATFHFMNILYHVLACLLLYFLLLKLCGNSLLSFALSFLFAIHPVNTHAIAWIPGRNDILLSIFVLLSMHGLLDYYRKKKPGYIVLHIIAFAAALFTKESGILLLPVYFAFIWLWQRDPSFYKRHYFLPIIYVAISVAWYFAMRHALKGQPVMSGQGSIKDTVIHNLPYLFLYLGKILLPFNLNVMPGSDTLAVVLGIVSFAIIIYIFLKIKDRRKAFFSLGWYFIFLAPTLLVPELPAYEHRDYLPLAGLLIGISQSAIFAGFSSKSRIQIRILAVLILVFLVITYTRIPVFADRFVFWNDGTEGTPFAPSACVNVGELYQEIYNNDPSLDERQKKEMLNKAGEWNHKAIEQDSMTLRGNNNYGAFLYLTGKPDEAVPYFQKEIKYHPTNSDPYKNLGIYYRDKGQPEKSVYYWEKLIQLNRFYLTAYEDLASYYAKKGDLIKAAQYREQEKKMAEQGEKE